VEFVSDKNENIVLFRMFLCRRSTVDMGFLQRTGLDSDFLLNIEANHATLAGHTFARDLQVAADQGMLGSIDANRGDLLIGWDTDQFPTDVYDTMEAMAVVLRAGGLKGGGFNFDAKLRRNSTDPEDLFLAHIGGMDAFALGLILADKMIQDGRIEEMRKNRYASFDSGKGKDFEDGRLTLEDLRDHAAAAVGSGRHGLYRGAVQVRPFDSVVFVVGPVDFSSS